MHFNICSRRTKQRTFSGHKNIIIAYINIINPDQAVPIGSVVVDFLFVVTPFVGVCNCFMFCCALLSVRSGVAVVLMGRRELVVLLNLSSWCLVVVWWLFLAVPWGCLWFVIVVFPDHTHLLFFILVASMMIFVWNTI